MLAKIAFLGNFRVDYSSESHHCKTLESLGHTVFKLQESEVDSRTVYETASDCDLFIWVHTHGWTTRGRYNMNEVLRRLKLKNIPTMTYHLDLWFGLKRQKDLQNDAVYTDIDHFFTVDRQMADWFNKHTRVKGHYLPAGVFDQECYYDPQKLVNDVIFVGTRRYHSEWEYRPKLIQWLEENYSSRFKHYGLGGVKNVRGEALNHLYASTKVVVGDSLCINFDYPDYWSDRIYETLGRGGFLIHPLVPGLEKEFKDKEHVVFYKYNDFKQLKELIDYYLENDAEREKIRKSGHEFVKNNYTYKHRWKKILEELGI